MRIGIPREIKPMEGRVALNPDACRVLSEAGHSVIVEQNAGVLSGYPDEQYIAAGASIGVDAATTYGESGLIVKVKEPVAGDLQYLHRNHLLFCYLHLAPNPELIHALQQIGLTAVAFETVETDSGDLPLLAPMSAYRGPPGNAGGYLPAASTTGRQGSVAGRYNGHRTGTGRYNRGRLRRQSCRHAGSCQRC